MYTTNSIVYPLIGVTSSVITTAIIDEFIKEAQSEVERIIKTTCIPKRVNYSFYGSGHSIDVTKQTPLLNVFKLKIDDVDISTDKIQIKETGEIYLTSEAERTYFSPKINGCFVQYLYGWLEEGDAEEVADLTKGADVDIEVEDASDYDEGDYVKIEGIGTYEVVKVKDVDETADTITVDLTQNHEEVILTKMGVPQIVQTLTAVLAAIKGSNYMIGNTYTFATSYSMPDYSVTKGVPYPHFNRNLEQLINQRDYLIKQLAAFPAFA